MPKMKTTRKSPAGIFDWNNVARFVLLARELDELEERQFTPDKNPHADMMVKYQFSSSGHELAQVLLALSLNHPYDAANVYYRSRPFMLASGLTVREAFAGGMARAGSVTEGRDVGVTFNMQRRTGATVLPMCGDVGSQYTPAAGWAQAIDYHVRVLGEKEWQGAIAVALGGEASTATNGFWSALNIATTLKLRMLFFIEDNAFGISVPGSLQTPAGDVAANLASFANLRVIQADGADPTDAPQKIIEAVRYVRSGKGPALLHLRVPRLRGHTYGEDARAYKSEKLLKEEAARDPIPRLKKFLGARVHWDALQKDVRDELARALDEVQSNPQPNPAEITKHVFSENSTPKGSPTPQPSGARINFLDAVRRTLESEMKSNPRILVFGEDVGPRGGVHRVTLGLQDEFGCERVFDTSLSEEGIMGRAQGMALAGLFPVPEIQFRKYADPATEQINNIGSLRWRTAGKFSAPMVLRIPVGYAHRIYGDLGDPWHSVSGEAIYAHTVGWRIAFPSNAADAAGLLRTALRGDDPTLFLEHRALLDTEPSRRPYPGEDYCLQFGIANVLTQGDELTVVTWGQMVYRCLQTASAFSNRIAVIDLRTIAPWDKETVLASLRDTGKLLIVHEDTTTGGFAGEIIATVASQAFEYLDAPIERVGAQDTPVPFNVDLMNAVLPSVERIRERMEKLLKY